MLTKRSEREQRRSRLRGALAPAVGDTFSRRGFLKASGVTSLGLAALSGMQPTHVRAAEPRQGVPGEITRKKTICPFCAVGCTIWAEVKNGVWIGQEPAFESPINLGTHCAKGAATRELAIGERRLKYPVKKENGAWKRISWEQAINEIGDKLLEIRESSGPDSVYWLGSAKFSNEMAYLHRKFAAFWGTNNTDHQARICHSTTVAGVANSFGYGAMTNSLNDLHNSKSMILLGSNPAEAHPVAMQHVLRAKESGSKLIVCDPRYTRTAAHADEFVRLRPGTDVAFLWGLLHVVLKNGWEDKEYIQQRVFGFDEVRKVIEDYPPDVVANITGVPVEQIERVAEMTAKNRPGTLIWCMGLTQSTIGNNKTRAACVYQLALGNIGKAGGGANIFRGHDNVQGATDIGVLCDNTPAYYGLSEDAWRHWARVWDVEYGWLQKRFASKDLMEQKGIPVSRWFDGVLEAKDDLDQPNNVQAMIFWGHAPNSQTRGADLKQGLEKVDLLVVIDPVPTFTAVIADRRDGTYLLPAGSTMEMAGSATNTNRSLQWREKVVEPIFEAKSDYTIAHLLAKKLGFADELFQHIEIKDGEPVAEDLLSEFNRGSWTIGYTGQSPERLKLHMQHQELFDTTSLLGKSGPVKGDYYGLPWPCWGTPEIKHPGTPLLWDPSKGVAEGGLPFRARWGVAHEGKNMLAENSYPKDSPIKDGYPEMTLAVIEKLGFIDQLNAREKVVIAAIAADTYRPQLLGISEADANTLLQQIEQSGTLQQQPGGQPATGQQPPTQGQAPPSGAQPGQQGNAAEQTEQARTQSAAEQVANRFPDLGPTARDAIVAYLAHAPKRQAQKEGSAAREVQQQAETGIGTAGQQQGEQQGEGQRSDKNAETGEQEFSGGDAGRNQEPMSKADGLREKILKVNWKTDLSGGIQRVAIANGLAPFGNGKARALVWNFPDAVPLHREPLYTPRRDLLPKYQTYKDRRDFRLPVLYRSIQEKNFADEFPIALTTGRLVEYEGGGDETRANKWLAEFQQEMFVEISPEDASVLGLTNGQAVWVHTPEGARVRVAAMITPRVGKGTAFMPFHFGGFWMGEDLSGRYPQGTVPYVVGEAANTAMTYGYDVVTFMQESKASLCRIEAA